MYFDFIFHDDIDILSVTEPCMVAVRVVYGDSDRSVLGDSDRGMYGVSDRAVHGDSDRNVW